MGYREANIRWKVRRGCSLQLRLLFIEITINTIKDKSKVIFISDNLVYSMRFVDNIALLAENKNEVDYISTENFQ